MPKKKHAYKLRVFEQPFRAPKDLEEAEANRTPKELKIDPSASIIMGRNVDDCLKKARAFVEEKMNRIVRTVNIGPGGIYAVVYSETEKKDPRAYSEKRLKGYPK